MSYGKYTVIYDKNGVDYKLTRIWFGADGSYYVTSPYHPDKRAFLMKIRVNYSLDEMTVPFEDAIDTASLDEDEQRLKLSHHPDGFVQFSGEGVLSGRDAHGVPRGMGVVSWPLDMPVPGPAIVLLVRNIEGFEQAPSRPSDALVFSDNEICAVPGADTLHLEGHYFPSPWRRFVRFDADGAPTISVLHPAGAILRLKVIFASARCARDGFIGLELYTDRSSDDFPDGPSFALTGPTGDVRRNLEGQVTATSIQCMYPRGDLVAQRILDYRMPEIAS
ncbi:MAG TPA: hypothetical protein VMP01_28300 [Pirellulaceae bacterium]|nr:hypothetical protein [Pirellulaceae bacterium]